MNHTNTHNNQDETSLLLPFRQMDEKKSSQRRTTNHHQSTNIIVGRQSSCCTRRGARYLILGTAGLALFVLTLMHHQWSNSSHQSNYSHTSNIIVWLSPIEWLFRRFSTSIETATGDDADDEHIQNGDMMIWNNPTSSYFSGLPPQVRDRPGFFGYPPPISRPLDIDNDTTTTTTTNSHDSLPPAINVSYSSRTILVNNEPVFLLGGSMHPVRHSPESWQSALDQAVRAGLNLVTIYVMWSAHQPWSPHEPLDWRFFNPMTTTTTNAAWNDTLRSEKCNHAEPEHEECWTMATAIRQAAKRRLWVHLRIGPYVCAEYNYGGLPEWIGINNNDESNNNNNEQCDNPNMVLRRPNRPWLNAMQAFVQNMTKYISSQRLWAYQGGNILLAQIENELQGDIGPGQQNDMLWLDTNTGKLVDHPNDSTRRANLQDYANWCGQLVQDLEPNVVWTMCQGLTAPNSTIETFNGVDGSDWLDVNGTTTHRVQQDFPALWTEMEGGFQIWGEDADHPTDYFWGQSARDYAFRILRWMARGGTHINYYMFAGGYNRDRMAAAGLQNMYANDALLCSSGEPRQPKFDHLQRIHVFLQDYATLWLASPTKPQPERVRVRNENGTWVEALPNRTLLFRYENQSTSIVFIENMQSDRVLARWNFSRNGQEESVTMHLNPWSVAVYEGSSLKIDSSVIDVKAKAYQRRYRRIHLPSSYEKTSFSLPPLSCPNGQKGSRPVEQTRLMLESRIWTDYVWYSTEWIQETALDGPIMLAIETQMANAFVIWLDGHRVATNDTHFHKEGPVTLTFPFPGNLEAGHHQLVLLSESLGYDNVIGVWGASTWPKTKGITGNVYLQTLAGNQSLVEGQDWCSCAGLVECGSEASTGFDGTFSTAITRTIWRFAKPQLIQGELLYVRLKRGRGHLSLNGIDLGRYWNITRAESGRYSQIHYFIPVDYLLSSGNELRVDNVFGEMPGNVQLIASVVVPSIPGESQHMEDIVDFPGACM